MIWINV